MTAKPFPELHRSFLSTTRTELSFFTRESNKPFGAAGVAANAGKTVVQVAAPQEMDHDLPRVGSPEAVAFRETFRVNLFEGFIVVLDALVEGSQMRLSGPVDRTGFGHRFEHDKIVDMGGSHS
jgi:hypothetical protein